MMGVIRMYSDEVDADVSLVRRSLRSGRGRALSFGLIALPYYRQTNPVLAAAARRAIDEVLADPG